jgi:hypothetical protein
MTNLQLSNDVDRHKKFVRDRFYDWDKDFVEINFVSLFKVVCNSFDFITLKIVILITFQTKSLSVDDDVFAVKSFYQISDLIFN